MERILTEHVPDYLVQRWRENSLLWARLVIGGIGAIFVPLGIGFAWLPFCNGSGSQQLIALCVAGAAFPLAWGLLVYFLGRFIAVGWSKDNLPIVRIAGEVMTVRWLGETIESPVEECNVRRGRAWQMKYASRGAHRFPFGDRDLILIDLPPLNHDIFGRVRASTTVAVGYTEESMKDWINALGISGEPFDRTKSNVKGYTDEKSTHSAR